jgi:hypothetical protein
MKIKSRFFIKQSYRKLWEFWREKSRGSSTKTSTLFTILEQDFKLKFAPLFAPLINLLKQT